EKIKEVFYYCLPISLSGLVTFFIDKMDQFVLASFLLAKDFAFYSMGCLVIPPLLLLEMSVNKVLIPDLSKILRNQEDGADKAFRKAVGDCAFLLIPACFGLYFYADEITIFLYTAKFIESSQYLKIFAFSYLFYMIPYDAAPRAAGQTNWLFKLTLSVAPFGLGAIIFTAMFMPAKAVLITALVFKLIPRLAGLIYSARLLNSKIQELIPWKKLLCFSIACCILTISSLTVKASFESSQQWFYVTAPLFAIFYFALLYVPYKKGALDV
ncbi:MAG: oligosaccharide flippase family protein, partial [Bacteriovoracaceae bacterium]|nr:oligosaccharide flippase family protein [Bacteriovoracaceae bacterium]